MSYGYGNYNYRRYDYTPPPEAASEPIEQAMAIFVSWARANGRSYFSSMVRENLARDLRSGASPEDAVRNLIARAPR